MSKTDIIITVWAVREQLKVLVKTINSFNFIKARPLDSIYRQGLPEGVTLHGLGIDGKEYLVYWLKNKPVSFGHWICAVPEGTYLIKWFDPLNGHVLQEKIIYHKGEKLSLKVPEFSDDLALRITAVNK